jgi:hypothetical protein
VRQTDKAMEEEDAREMLALRFPIGSTDARPSTTLRSAQGEEVFFVPQRLFLILSAVEGRTAFVPSVSASIRPEDFPCRRSTPITSAA